MIVSSTWPWLILVVVAIATEFAVDLWLRTPEKMAVGVEPQNWDAAMTILIIVGVLGMIFDR